MSVIMNDLWMRRIAILLVVSVAFISIVPRVQAAFVTSDESFSSSMRQQDMATVKKILEQKLVQQRLKALGYSEQEVTARLDKLSDNELHRFATQLDTLAAGGDSLGVIVVILVIVGIIALVLFITGKRVVIQ